MWNFVATIPRVEARQGSVLRSVVLLILASAIVLCINYRLPGSYLGSDKLLARELRSPIDSVYLWRLADEVPFKYRMLFASTVLSTWSLWRDNENDNRTFKIVYRLLTFLCFILAVITFFLLLMTLGFNNAWSLGGAITYLLLPPMSMAFTYPVHTKEDLLGFVLLNAGLIAFFKQHDLLFIFLCTLGAFCRETLLILPFIYLIYSKSTLVRKFVFVAIPAGVVLGLRIATGFQSYDIIGMGFMRNIQFLFQSTAFLFMSFNALWILFFFSRKLKNDHLTENQQKMLNMSLVVVLLIFVTAFLGGRIMELRLIFLAAPWVIVGSLIALKPRLESLLHSVKKQSFLWTNLVITIFLGSCFLIGLYLRPQTFDIMKPAWWVILFLSCHASLILLWMFGTIPPKQAAGQ